MDSIIPLGKITQYPQQYAPELLYPIKREIARHHIGLSSNSSLPFRGYDLWNCYEFSWLNLRGMPQVAVLELIIDANSENIVESKSLKLYLNSFMNSRFESIEEVMVIIERDLTTLIKGSIIVKITRLAELADQHLAIFSGICLDKIDLTIEQFILDRDLIKLDINQELVEEVLYSDLLKSNCLVTNQPDWASIQITYQGPKIDHQSLLAYLISFRNHNEFHEQCVERIFMDIFELCRPTDLTVYARYTRRGGIDINPFRSMRDLNVTSINKLRQVRQ